MVRAHETHKTKTQSATHALDIFSLWEISLTFKLSLLRYPLASSVTKCPCKIKCESEDSCLWCFCCCFAALLFISFSYGTLTGFPCVLLADVFRVATPCRSSATFSRKCLGVYVLMLFLYTIYTESDIVKHF